MRVSSTWHHGRLALTTTGGNDAGLVDILNQCVYQFFSPTDILTFLLGTGTIVEALQNLHLIDIGKYSRTCEQQMDESETLINDQSFSQNIKDLIDAAKTKLASDGTIYYTSYAKFWDDDATDDDWCSKPENTWSVFLSNVPNIMSFQAPVVLTKDRRIRMNSLVDLVNSKISDAVAAAGDQVEFINYDEYIDDVGGRYCSPGVEEPEQTRWALFSFPRIAKQANSTQMERRIL